MKYNIKKSMETNISIRREQRGVFIIHSTAIPGFRVRSSPFFFLLDRIHPGAPSPVPTGTTLLSSRL
jgi:hypothetical protein